MNKSINQLTEEYLSDPEFTALLLVHTGNIALNVINNIQQTQGELAALNLALSILKIVNT
jgi:uncharacterized protein YejL (UPF0352 family)